MLRWKVLFVFDVSFADLVDCSACAPGLGRGVQEGQIAVTVHAGGGIVAIG